MTGIDDSETGLPLGLAAKRDILQMSLPLVCCREATLSGLLKKRGGLVWFKPHPRLAEHAAFTIPFLSPSAGEFVRRGKRLVVPGLSLRELRKRVRERISEQLRDPVRVHCCRAFLRGLFLGSGYLESPDKGYHLEIILASRGKARLLGGVARRLRLPFHFFRRRGRVVAYLKGRKPIIRFLKQAELFEQALIVEDVAVTRQISEMVNRQVNLETANITRRIETSDRQIEAIRQLLQLPNQDFWTDSLHLMAITRVKFPEDSLEALGGRFSPPLSKSAVNHRLRRIMKLHEDRLERLKP